MSELDERTNDWLRRSLAGHRRPALAPGSSTRVLRRLAERKRERDGRRRGWVRAVLLAYWVAAAFGTVWLLARLPWPDWTSPIAWALAVAAVPAAFAVSLWPERARAWLLALLRPLAPPLLR
ncbi:MAG: hypothetical protein ACHP85_23910 [Burkholderiales bacterium]